MQFVFGYLCRFVCPVSKQQQLIASISWHPLWTCADSRPGQHREASSGHSCPWRSSVLYRPQPSGHTNSHGFRKSKKGCECIDASMKILDSVAYWKWTFFCFCSGDTDQNIWHICGSFDPGVKTRIADCKHILVSCQLFYVVIPDSKPHSGVCSKLNI